MKRIVLIFITTVLTAQPMSNIDKLKDQVLVMNRQWLKTCEFVSDNDPLCTRIYNIYKDMFNHEKF